MSTVRVQVLAVNRIEGINPKDGQPYAFDRAECIATFDGMAMTFSTRLRQGQSIKPGAYEVPLAWSRDQWGEPRGQVRLERATPVAAVKAA